MWLLRIGLILGLFATSAAAVLVDEVVHYPTPLKRLQGEIVDGSDVPVDHAHIAIFNNPSVEDDDSLTPIERRSRQKQIFETTSDEHGRYKVKKLPKGSYEIEFTGAAMNILSVIVQIDPSAKSDNLCVGLRFEGGGGETGTRPCRQ